MARFFARLFHVHHTDTDVQRRGRNIIMITLGVIMMSLGSLPLALIQPDPLPQTLPVAVGSLVNLGVLMLARSGRVTSAAVALVGVLLAGLILTPLASRQVGLVPVFLLVPVVVAGVTGRPWLAMLTAGLSLGGITLMGVALTNDPQKLATAPEVLAVGGILAVMFGLVSTLGAYSTNQALVVARDSRERLERAAAELNQANRELERRVEERTSALQTALEQAERRETEQARLLAQVESQRQTIRAMSVPVLPVSVGALVMPLVGALDGERLATVQEEALAAVERTEARRLLLDVTGVPVIDTHVAQGLVGVIRAVRLLGAEAILIGVAPEVAQALVGLGLDLRELRTERDLREALVSGARSV